jgi:preprotein translocase subunit SecE
MDIFKKIKTFFSEVKSELKKVNWPTKKDTIRDTLTVIGVSVVIAAFLGGVDFLITALLRRFMM